MMLFPRNLIMRFGAFIGVMAFCYGLVMIGAWRMSVVKPALSVSMPSFEVTAKAQPAKTNLHAKNTGTSQLAAIGALKADICKEEKHMCGRHDGDSCNGPSLYCGCHSHDAGHGTVASGAPDTLPSSVEVAQFSPERLAGMDEPVFHEFLITFERERPPSSLLV